VFVGPTASGKTSLLHALLGEMHDASEGPDSWTALPRAGGVAFAVQESWIENGTIRVTWASAHARIEC
jgi:GTPase SAR1 family protein